MLCHFVLINHLSLVCVKFYTWNIKLNQIFKLHACVWNIIESFNPVLCFMGINCNMYHEKYSKCLREETIKKKLHLWASLLVLKNLVLKMCFI